MDPETNLDVLVDDLDVNIDELTTALAPLLSQPIHKTAATLPLLDKAKLYVFTAYAIESLVFSTLQASGVNAKEHAVFKELARLKGYTGKITQAEEAGEGGKQRQPGTRVDKGAAARFIKHGLAGNERYDLERAERIAKERAKAALKARQMHVKFDQNAEEEKQAELAKKRKAEQIDEQEEGSSSEEETEAEGKNNHVESENEDFYGNEAPSTRRSRKKSRVSASDSMHIDANDNPSSSALVPTRTPSKKSKKNKKRKNSATSNPTSPAAEPSTPVSSESASQSQPQSKEERRASKRAKKTANRLTKIQSIGGRKTRGEELVLPERSQEPPKTRSEMFSALLDGSFAERKREKAKAKKSKNK